MELTREDRAAVEKLQQLAKENRIDIAGGQDAADLVAILPGRRARRL